MCDEENGNGLDILYEEMMTALPNKHYGGHHKATEEEGDQVILGKELWRKKCGQQDTSTARGRWKHDVVFPEKYVENFPEIFRKIWGNFPREKYLFLYLTVLHSHIYFEHIYHLISSDDDDGYGVNVGKMQILCF